MFKQASLVLGSQIVSFQTGRKLGEVLDFIADDNSGKILALVIKKSMFGKPKEIISTVNILEIISKFVVVRADDVISPPEEILKVSEMIKNKIKLFGNRVKTEKGVYLGRVSDFVFEMPGFNLSKLYLSANIFSLITGEKVIDASKIKKITKKAVIVSDDAIGEEIIPGAAKPA